MSSQPQRRDLNRRSRRTLLWCAFFLVLSPLPGGWLVDHCPLPIRFPLAAATISSWTHTTPPPDILCLGSSRLGSFLRTKDLTRLVNEVSPENSAHVFNATLMGGEPITMEFLAGHLLGDGRRAPRVVVLETSSDLLPRDNLYFKLIISRQLTARELRKYIADIVLCHDAIPRLVSSRLTPFYLHRGQFLAWAEQTVRQTLPPQKLDADEKPPGTLNAYGRDEAEKALPPPDERLRIALRRFNIHLRHYQLAGATSAAFERTVAMLHARGCVVLLVQTPLSSAQRALFSSDMRAQFNDFIERLQRTYGCRFVDYSDRLPDTLFSDNHHANDAGSIAFTKLLAQEVVAPAWRNVEDKP